MSQARIRPESLLDADAIRELHVSAFRDHPHSRQTEHLVVDALRSAGALDVSLVALLGTRLAGHVAFSEARVGRCEPGWLLLGPVAVLAEFQGRGIGSALVDSGLSQLRVRGAKGWVLVGAPRFYGRFGFRTCPGLVYEGVPREYVLALSFGDVVPSGVVRAHEAFGI